MVAPRNTSVRIPPRIKASLKRAARKDRRSLHAMIVIVLDEWETFYDRTGEASLAPAIREYVVQKKIDANIRESED